MVIGSSPIVYRSLIYRKWNSLLGVDIPLGLWPEILEMHIRHKRLVTETGILFIFWKRGPI